MPNKVERIKTNYPGVYYIMSKATDGRPEKIYYIFYRKGGKQIEEKAGRQFQNDMTPARAARIRTQRIEGDPSNQERREEARQEVWTITRLWQEYSAHKPITKGLTTDRSRFQKFIEPTLGKKEPQELSPLDVDRLRISTAKNHKPQTVKHVIALLVRIINHGARLGLCPGLSFKPPTIKVHNLKTEDLSPEQLAALMEAINEDHDYQAANFMRLALCTGMRRGELFKLTWADIDFERGYITIRAPKGGKDQIIPLNQAAREVLESHPKDESPFVFPGREGRQRTRYPKRIDAIRKRANLPPDFRPLHGLRHVYASMLASSGQVDLYTLQKLLTHKSAAMTQRYAHLRDEALRRASDLAGDLIGQALNGNKPPRVAQQRRED
ncbi:MAG: site-specific integrase [Deltaproteobacteria bacterium]|nr:site-specific integrase [Deltaproteobacteria bacterium]